MELELLKTIFSLIAVLGLMFAVLFAMKRISRGGIGGRSDIVEIEVLSQRALQPKRMLYVVKVLNKVMVISSTEHGIQPVGEISDATTIREIEAKQQSRREQKDSAFVSFKQRLRAAETIGEFFHKPLNVILWKGDKPGVPSGAETREATTT